MNPAPHPAARLPIGPLTWGLIVCILWFFTWRIQTYVTAQDPSIYIGLARRILANPIGAAESSSVLFRLAPGYPVLLALSIRLFGDFAPYWLNLGLAAGYFYVLGRLMTRWHGSGLAPALILLVSAVILLTGYALNPHFLLYPFRATPCYASVFLAYLILDSHFERPHSLLRAGGSGLFLLFAVLIREPMVFALIGAVGCVVSSKGWGGSRRTVLALVLPFLVVLIIGLVVAAATGRWATVQALSISRDLGSRPAPEALWAYAATAWELVRQVREELTWAGVATLVAGLWIDRRRREMWWLLVVPAGLLLAFYACLEPHRRYTLSILAFLCPVAGAGVVGVLKRAAEAAETRGLQRAAPILYAAFMAVCVLALVGSGWRQRPWGPRVSRADVRAFQAGVAEFALPGDVIYSEWACRHLGDAVQSYTAQSAAADPRGIDRVWREGRTAYFFKPLNDEAYMASIQDRHHGHVEGLITYGADLAPVRDSSGTQRMLTMAAGQFAVYEVLPWSTNEVRQLIPARPGRALVIWLDLKVAGQRADGAVRVLDGEANLLAEASLVPGNAVQVVAVPADRIRQHEVMLEVAADRAIPSDPVYAVRTDAAPVDFDLMYRRSPSVYGWFRPPFVPLSEEQKYIAMFQQGGRLCLPPVLGSESVVEAMLVVTPAPGHAGPIEVTYRRDGQRLAVFQNRLEESRFRHIFTIGAVPPGEDVCTDIDVAPTECLGGHLRIHRIRLRVRGPGPRTVPAPRSSQRLFPPGG